MTRLLSLLAMAVVASGAGAAEPTDPAALFPPGVLLYAEVGNPGDTATAISKYVKDTVLADAMAFGHDRRDKMTQPQQLAGLMRSQLFGLFTTPEALAEAKRLRGAAVALTGFDAKTGKPQWAAAVLTGESHATGLQLRSYLTLAPNVRRVGKVEGVAVYQNRGLTGAAINEQGRPLPPEDGVPPEGANETTYLYAPGLFVVGSGKVAVADVYCRFAGKDTSASFAGSVALKAAAETRKKPGAFLFADVAAFEEKTAKLKGKSPDFLPADVTSPIRFLLNSKAVKVVTGQLRIEPDGVGVVLTGDVTPGAESPLHALASGPALGPDPLRIPADAPAGFTWNFPPKPARAKAVLAVADAISSATGRIGASPSEQVAEARKAGFAFETDLLTTLANVTVYRAAKLDRPKGVPEFPLLALRLDSEDAAKAWEAQFPKVAALMIGAEKPPEVSSEAVLGVRVLAVVAVAESGKIPVHFARVGDRIAVGVDQKLVAALAREQPKTVPLAGGEGGAAVGLLRLASFLPEPGAKPGPMPAVIPNGLAPTDLKRLEDLINDRGVRDPLQPAPLPGGSGVTKPQYDAAKALAPVTVSVGAKGTTLRVEVWHRDSKKALSAAFEQGVIWIEQQSNSTGPGGYPERDGPIIIDRFGR